MSYYLNTTANYHKNDLTTLGWELTVCNSLEPPDSPCRKALKHPGSFGSLLYHFLARQIPLPEITSILEIGGGMGYLMRDFLSLNPSFKTTMLDISPFLLSRQKAALGNYNVKYQEMDIMDASADYLAGFELVILNENLGDFPTFVYQVNNDAAADISTVERLKYFRENYQLPLTLRENINIGALEVLEKLCRAEIKYIYLSEHSCEALLPENFAVTMEWKTNDNPEKISLQGHDEFTIKFSFLQKIAERFNYQVTRGCFADFLEPDFNDRVQTSLHLVAAHTDEQEILRQFIYDLFKYEYLILKKEE